MPSSSLHAGNQLALGGHENWGQLGLIVRGYNQYGFRIPRTGAMRLRRPMTGAPYEFDIDSSPEFPYSVGVPLSPPRSSPPGPLNQNKKTTQGKLDSPKGRKFNAG